jgi:SAM-dependent methyltransferase
MSAFDGVAETYDAIRPGYPVAVFDAIADYRRTSSTPRVLEIGVGTGQATAQMAARGWHVVGLEPGEKLAAVARGRLTRFRHDVSVITTTFEAADVESRSFDLVASATAWHWVDPAVGYEKAARCLQPDGVIALWWNAHVPDTRDPGWAPIR